MTELRDHTKDKVITTYVSLNKAQEALKMVTTTLDGKHHVQRIGGPIVVYDLRLFLTATGRDDIYTSENEATLLKVTVDNVITYGRILERGEPIYISPKYYEMTVRISEEAAPT